MIPCFWIFSRWFSKRKITNIKDYKKRTKNGQSCSLCKRVDRLTFYAANDNKVIGVCSNCKPHVEHLGYLPL